jgi:hypothetical protein
MGYGQREYRLYHNKLQDYGTEQEHVLPVPHSGVQKGGYFKGLQRMVAVKDGQNR